MVYHSYYKQSKIQFNMLTHTGLKTGLFRGRTYVKDSGAQDLEQKYSPGTAFKERRKAGARIRFQVKSSFDLIHEGFSIFIILSRSQNQYKGLISAKCISIAYWAKGK